MSMWKNINDITEFEVFERKNENNFKIHCFYN